MVLHTNDFAEFPLVGELGTSQRTQHWLSLVCFASTHSEGTVLNQVILSVVYCESVTMYIHRITTRL